MKFIRLFNTLCNDDTPIVGGKNASLGEMIQFLKKNQISVPDGFATTSSAYWAFIEHNNLKKIFSLLKKITKDKKNLSKIASTIRSLILSSTLPKELEEEIITSYERLSALYKAKNTDVAVRSSATAEDLPSASFAGQHESFLNVKGKKNLILSCIKCYASLFTDRAIVYRIEKGFEHEKIALSIGVQKMVRSDKAGSGVIFTLDTETGFRDVITITAGWGLGENIVQGTIIPDEYQVYKPFTDKKELCPIIEKNLGMKNLKLVYGKKSYTKNVKTSRKEKDSFVLSDSEVITLASWAKIIEDHYQKPMDIEWAKDGLTEKLFIVQSRPETVQSQIKLSHFKSYSLKEKKTPLISGLSIGESITTGKVQVIKSIKEIGKFKKGSILVTHNTTPDWMPIMKIAKGIITDHGGRTSHAAIVSRELNIPAIVGTSTATSKLKDDSLITLSCAQGERGFVYEGALKFTISEENIDKLPVIKTPLMINIASPSAAFQWWQLPTKGIGLARMEFIIDNFIKIHPMALVHFEKVKSPAVRQKILDLTKGHKSKEEYFIDILSRSLAKIAASQYPKDVIVRTSDFKTNEYASLIGGSDFESKEDNPMIGFRGASRYYNKKYKDAFKLECLAIKRAREVFGFDNIIVMIPFCRTLDEADKVISILSENGLKRGQHKLQLYVMCEIPSNFILAEKFSERFDGFSIGSNDLTQLILGIDRDSTELAPLFDERNEAVKEAIKEVIKKAHQKKCKVGICGQAPSDYPEFAKFLIDEKIDSISLNPDSVISIIKKLSSTKKP